MWIRKCYLDDQSDIQSPIPNRISSNEEFIPPPQSAKEREVENRLRELANKNAKLLGVSRRRFLQSSCGMAAAMLCFNEVFGKTYEVEPVEALDPAAFEEHWPKTDFIFDNQTHHIDVESGWFEKTESGREAAAFLRRFRPGEKTTAASLEALNEGHYVKELFFDSDTVMSIISGVPSRMWNENILPPDKMVKTRNDVNGWAGSQRMLSHGLLRPNLGPADFDEMERQVKVLKINSWKMYPGAEMGDKGWWLDDEKVAYPVWEKSRKLGVRNLCIHKGLPLGLFNEEHCHPRDVEKAAKDFPDFNFIIYHSGWHPTARVKEGTAANPQYIPWISDLIDIVKRNKFKNVFFELGSTWNGTSSGRPEVAMHLFGQLLNIPGVEDQIIWGTDSIWGGSPQSQIERFRRFQIRDDIAEKFGYRKLTPEIKAKVFGLNAARIYKIDVKAKRNAIKTDKIAQAREQYLQDPRPSNTQFGWVWQSHGRRA
ncbi:MAG TPA: amidohydrolase family protein [Blastocatellia bacterium]|nr:amidohydrolase family protein [Blastocatellia bacterium]